MLTQLDRVDKESERSLKPSDTSDSNRIGAIEDNRQNAIAPCDGDIARDVHRCSEIHICCDIHLHGSICLPATTEQRDAPSIKQRHDTAKEKVPHTHSDKTCMVFANQHHRA